MTSENRNPHLVNIVLEACRRSSTDKVTFGIFEAMKRTGLIAEEAHFDNYDGHPVQEYIRLQVAEDVGYKSQGDAVSCLIARGGNYSIIDEDNRGSPYHRY